MIREVKQISYQKHFYISRISEIPGNAGVQHRTARRDVPCSKYTCFFIGASREGRAKCASTHSSLASPRSRSAQSFVFVASDSVGKTINHF